jgi:hypothetical protein
MGIFQGLFPPSKPSAPGQPKPGGDTLGDAIQTIIEDRHNFFKRCFASLTDDDKVVLSLLELFIFTTAHPAKSEEDKEQHHRFLDQVHSAAYALLHERKLVQDSRSFEALAQSCYQRWNEAFAKGKPDKLPSGFYWLAKDVLLTLRPNEDPDIALIDGLAEYITHAMVSWRPAPGRA